MIHPGHVSIITEAQALYGERFGWHHAALESREPSDHDGERRPRRLLQPWRRHRPSDARAA